LWTCMIAAPRQPTRGVRVCEDLAQVHEKTQLRRFGG
jgi:hypothetical protein